jgi:hypothetical protein
MTNVHNPQSTTLALRLFNPNVIKVVSIALAIVFGLLYVAQMNESSMRGYAIRDLEAKKRELIQGNDKLLTEIDRLRSLASISERQTFLQMVKAEKVEYVKVSRTDVALSR